MRLGSHHFSNRVPTLEFSMTSMIDVVFLLLIFFLVTTTFIQPERQLDSNIRVEKAEAGFQEDDLEPAILDLFVVEERVIYQFGARQTSKLEELQRVLENFDNKSDGGFVRVGFGVAFDHAAKAIGLFKASGFTHVSYLPAK